MPTFPIERATETAGESAAGESPRRSRPRIKVEAFLAKLPMFSEMNAEELGRIAAGAEVLYAEKGEQLCRAGDPCTGFHVVVYGEVKLAIVSPQGIEKVVDIIRPGQSFGEALMLLEEPYIVYVQALSDAMLLRVSRQSVDDELARDPRFARRMLAGLARRLHGLVRDVEAYTLQSGSERVIGYLLGEVPDGAGAGAVNVALAPGKNVIASRLNMSPEHFSRILHELAARALIEIEGRTVRIPDLDRLRGSTAK